MIKNRLLVLAGLVLTLSLSAPKNVFCSAAPETAKDARERLEPLFFGLHDRTLNDAGLQIIKDYASNSVRYFVSDYQEDMQLVASFVNITIDNLVNRDLKAPNKSCKWIIFRCEQIQTLCDVYHHRITEPQGQNLVAAYNKIKDDPTLLLATNRLGRMLGLPPITLRDIPTAEKPAEAPKPLLEAPRRVPPAAHTPSQSASIAGAGAGAGSAAQAGDLINAAQSAEFLRILSNKELTIAKRREAYTQINTLLDNGFVPSKEQLIPIKYVGLIERFPERMPTYQATASDPVLTADQRRFYEEMEALYYRVQRIINQNKARLATGTGAGSAVTDAAQRVAPSAPAESASFAGAGAGAGSAGGASAGAADSSSEDAVGQIQRLFTGIQAIVNDPAAMLLKDQHGQATRLAQEAAEIMGRERLSLQTKDTLMSLYRTRIHQKLTDYINEMMGDEGVHRDIGLRGGFAKMLQPKLYTIITKHLLNNRGLGVVMPSPEAGAGSSGGAAGGASAGAADSSSEDSVGQLELKKLGASVAEINGANDEIKTMIEYYETATRFINGVIDDLARRKTYDALRRPLIKIAVSRQAPSNCNFTQKQEDQIAAAYQQLAKLASEK